MILVTITKTRPLVGYILFGVGVCFGFRVYFLDSDILYFHCSAYIFCIQDEEKVNPEECANGSDASLCVMPVLEKY